MEPAASKITTCPGCDTLEETSGRGLGNIFHLLRIGISEEDEGPQSATDESNLFANEERFGIYKIERRADGSLDELGHGAMGVTYRAIDVALQRKVALKIIKPGLAGPSAEARERFLCEARAAAALRHEHIATVFQFGVREKTGQCFYAMELIEGETLEERVRRAGPLDVRTTVYIAEQVTAALAASEKRHIIHRDLKPANLMLLIPQDAEEAGAPGCATPTVKIIDFGLAEALNAPTDTMRFTHHGFVGTPAFASPEQLENSRLGVRSDIYSLGLTMWFALTGKIPFDGDSLEEIRRARQSTALPIEQLKAAHVSYHVRSLLKSMLAADPTERLGTRDLAARLQRCIPQEPGAQRGHVAALAAAVILALGVFTLSSPPPHSPAARSISHSSQMTDFIHPGNPSTPVRVDPAKVVQEDRTPQRVPPVEQEFMVPQPLELYSLPQATAKPEKQGSHNYRSVARRRPIFFGRFVEGFIKLQKRQPVK
jgi:serine/threonine protein kinase